MGQNKTLPSPEAYPVVFNRIVKEGGGVLYLDDVPWTEASTVKRFRLFIRLLRGKPTHPLHLSAERRWSISSTPHALLITSGNPTRDGSAGKEELAIALINRALFDGGGNRGKP